MNTSTTPTSAIDPVCGMTVDPAKAAGASTREGETYYFCSRPCKETFDAETAPVTSCGCSAAC